MLYTLINPLLDRDVSIMAYWVPNDGEADDAVPYKVADFQAGKLIVMDDDSHPYQIPTTIQADGHLECEPEDGAITLELADGDDPATVLLFSGMTETVIHDLAMEAIRGRHSIQTNTQD